MTLLRALLFLAVYVPLALIAPPIMAAEWVISQRKINQKGKMKCTG